MKTLSRFAVGSVPHGYGIVALAMLFMGSLLLMNAVLLVCGQLVQVS